MDIYVFNLIKKMRLNQSAYSQLVCYLVTLATIIRVLNKKKKLLIFINNIKKQLINTQIYSI